MEPLLTTEELCKMLKTRESFIRNLRSQGRIPYVKVGRLVRYRPEDISAWLKGQSARIVSPEVEQKSEEFY
jgi:excisionase family DNA binding protein